MQSPKLHQDNPISQSPSYRWLENGHIFLWLLKDTCWAMEFKVGGLVMIVPTIAVAIYILWRSRGHRQDFFHNIAVCLWITGNSVWMTGEFFKQEWRGAATIIFIVGLAIMGFYYLFYFKKDRMRE
ncbi:MAG: hypothetical protein EBZ77_03330 [Chitinophagia bacterium]|nr:hypothetical protein [Chitinophagia bacterium]